MTKHSKSVSRKISPKPRRDPEQEKIGSRVFPLRGPPVSTPSVGTRRSTRVFVPKNVPKVAPDDLKARVLRSGKRLVLLEPVAKKAVGDGDGDGDGNADGWIQLFGSSGATEHTNWWKGEKEGFGEKQGEKEGFGKKQGRWHASGELNLEGNQLEEEPPKCVLDEDSGTASLHGKAFGVVYSRKRQRSQSDGSDSFSSWKGAKKSKDGLRSLSDGLVSLSTESGDKYSNDHRFGVVFVRKPQKKPKLPSIGDLTSRCFAYSEKGLDNSTETAHDFAEKVGILERDLWFGSVGHVVLVVLIQSTSSASSYRFTCFLVSILTWMMKKKVSLFECAAFMSSRSVARVFSLHGIHFLPVRHWKSDFSRRSAISDAGICIIFGARLLIPLVTVNFSVLPILFKSLHLRMSLCSLYLPSVLARYQRESFIGAHMEVSFEERRLHISHIHSETCTSRVEVISFGNLAANESDVDHASQILPANKVSSVMGSSELAARNITIINNVRFQKHQRKRSSLRSGRAPSRSLLKRRRKSFVDRQSAKLKVDTGAKVCPMHESCVVEHVHKKINDSCLGEICAEEFAAASPTPNWKRRKCTRKNSMRRLKELKFAFAEAKQSIDMLSCTANILVIESDRCWREEGAKVMLELSSSNEWCLAIKSGDNTRYLHKAQDMKPSVTNRYTHAMMWAGESGWKLEFCKKKEWNVFKELHKECCERNVQEVPVRIIPVPGVREVFGYEESVTSFFVRPDSYIHMVNEVERVLMSENACYDMDSGDEEWLERLNSSSLNGDTDSFTPITEDNFEKIISAFEKAAYSHPDDVSELQKATALCSNFGRRDMVADAFDYWMKKRKQKRSALVRVFQGQPPRKAQQAQKPFLRKKRSFKRQGNYAGRGKPEIFLEAAAHQDAIRKLQEAEADASRAVAVAIRLRSRAQVLMKSADLAVYKSVFALRLAESLQESESPDLSSAILG